MFAVAFDLVVAETRRHHPKGVPAAYGDIAETLERYGFRWTQGSLYLTDDDDLARLFLALQALKKLPWFAPSVRDVRAFRVEQWSDFTSIVKSDA
jgi:virulence-associated protein VapD